MRRTASRARTTVVEYAKGGDGGGCGVCVVSEGMLRNEVMALSFVWRARRVDADLALEDKPRPDRAPMEPVSRR